MTAALRSLWLPILDLQWGCDPAPLCSVAVFQPCLLLCSPQFRVWTEKKRSYSGPTCCGSALLCNKWCTGEECFCQQPYSSGLWVQIVSHFLDWICVCVLVCVCPPWLSRSLFDCMLSLGKQNEFITVTAILKRGHYSDWALDQIRRGSETFPST